MKPRDSMLRDAGPTGSGIVWTNAARCRDCNKCVRVCPVKAVRKAQGQAQVVADMCLLCGMCVRECPQAAKSYRTEIGTVEELMRTAPRIIASVAPSYLVSFGPGEVRALPSVLRRLGFDLVTETAVGARLVATESRRIIDADPKGRYISTACPAVVNYIRRYRQDAIGALMPVASPMVAHARYLRSRYGRDSVVVFVGPCIAKKEEAARPGERPEVDAVLTFEELVHWMGQRGLSLSNVEDSDFDDADPELAAAFPVSGGFALAAGLSTDRLDRLVLTVTGPDGVKEAVDYVVKASEPVVVEALMCPGGCLGGVGMTRKDGRLALRRAFLRSLEASNREVRVRRAAPSDSGDVDLHVQHDAVACSRSEPDDEGIRRILARMGKTSPSDELNCGACGYDTCREKAKAVLNGMAEIEMCIPFMRRSAETKMDAIVQNSPNAIVILDADLRIVHANPRFCEMFMTGEHCRGKHVSYFMDPDPYERVLAEEMPLYDETVHHSAYGLVCQQLVYRVESGHSVQVVGIMVNLTRSKKQEQELDMLRKEALERAEEVIDRQVEIAQEIAKLLGASAAETRSILTRLTDLVKRQEGE